LLDYEGLAAIIALDHAWFMTGAIVSESETEAEEECKENLQSEDKEKVDNDLSSQGF
jgi:hypothetical protein